MSLIDTYNTVKELIKTNLEEKGVETSEEDGLTTLANKILTIEGETESAFPTTSLTIPATFNDYNNFIGLRPETIVYFIRMDSHQCSAVIKQGTLSLQNAPFTFVLPELYDLAYDEYVDYIFELEGGGDKQWGLYSYGK